MNYSPLGHTQQQLFLCSGFAFLMLLFRVHGDWDRVLPRWDSLRTKQTMHTLRPSLTNLLSSSLYLHKEPHERDKAEPLQIVIR